MYCVKLKIVCKLKAHTNTMSLSPMQVNPESVYPSCEIPAYTVEYDSNKTIVMCQQIRKVLTIFDSIIPPPHIYHMMRVPNDKEMEEQRHRLGDFHSISMPTQMDAGKMIRQKQEQEEFIRAHVALHPNVYGTLGVLQEQNAKAIKALLEQQNEICDRYLLYDELLDDRIEALIQQDPETPKNHADLKVQLDLRAKYSASRNTINMAILGMMGDGAHLTK